MITVTLQEAKAKLNKLVERAHAGEDVVLMRGSQVVATILPLSSDDLEISSKLRDVQAEKFWEEIAQGKTKSFQTTKEAVEFLKKSR